MRMGRFENKLPGGAAKAFRACAVLLFLLLASAPVVFALTSGGSASASGDGQAANQAFGVAVDTTSGNVFVTAHTPNTSLNMSHKFLLDTEGIHIIYFANDSMQPRIYRADH